MYNFLFRDYWMRLCSAPRRARFGVKMRLMCSLLKYDQNGPCAGAPQIVESLISVSLSGHQQRHHSVGDIVSIDSHVLSTVFRAHATEHAVCSSTKRRSQDAFKWNETWHTRREFICQVKYTKQNTLYNWYGGRFQSVLSRDSWRPPATF